MKTMMNLLKILNKYPREALPLNQRSGQNTQRQKKCH